MSVNNSRTNVGYGISNALQNLAPLPIIARRDPTSKDVAELGTNWINPSSNTVWVITSVVAGVATWSTSPASGTGIFTDVEITGAPATDVLTVDAGNVVVTAGDVTLSGLLTTGTLSSGDATIVGNVSVTGDSTFNGNVDVTGDVTITGDFDITDTGSISLTSTNNAAGAIALTVNGGTSETLVLHSVQGTGADAIDISADAGGVDIDAAGLIAISSSRNNAQAILLESTAGGMQLTATGTAGEDISLTASGSSINLVATENAALTIFLHANGGTSETIDIYADQGTGVASINVHSDVGGLTFASGLASADAINITASDAAGGIDVDAGTAGFIVDTTGAVSLDSAAASNFTVTGAFDLTLSSTLGSAIVSGGEAVADAVQLTAGDAAGGVTVASGTGGFTVNSTNGIVALNSGTAAINVGTDAVAHTVTIGNIIGASAVAINSGTGGVALVSTGAGDITAASGDTLLLDSVGVMELNSSAGVISIGNDAVAQNINIGTGAAARTITVGNISGATGLVLNSGTGGIAMVSTGAGDITAASSDTLLLDSAGVLELNSSAGAISIGNDAVAQAINIGTGAAARTITVGNGSGATHVVVNSGSAGVDIGTNAIAQPVTIGNVTGTTSVAVNSGTGGIALVSTGAGDITAASGDTLLLDAVGVLELNSSGGNISIGNDADAHGINIGTAGVRTILMGNASAGTTFKLNSPANVGISLQNDLRIITGAGSPNGAVTAPAGSLWLRTDPAGATSRIYVNTDSGTTWTNVTCAA